MDIFRSNDVRTATESERHKPAKYTFSDMCMTKPDSIKVFFAGWLNYCLCNVLNLNQIKSLTTHYELLKNCLISFF